MDSGSKSQCPSALQFDNPQGLMLKKVRPILLALGLSTLIGCSSQSQDNLDGIFTVSKPSEVKACLQVCVACHGVKSLPKSFDSIWAGVPAAAMPHR